MYAVTVNDAHEVARHVIPDEVQDFIGDTIECIWYTPALRELYKMHDGEKRINLKKNAVKKYSIVECMALVFYLKYVFESTHTFQTVVRKMDAVAIIVHALIEFDKATGKAAAAINATAMRTAAMRAAASSTAATNSTTTSVAVAMSAETRSPAVINVAATNPSAASVTAATSAPVAIASPSDRECFDAYLRELLHEARRCGFMTYHECNNVVEVWLQLTDSELCVIPSVLLMSKCHTANEW